ncbi:MAG: helix-hairpin-helix domain-containing protein [Flavobacteriaceae bacterium]|nr:helix-hairpin-helix domain-containing protein [Flavobacteriaceae bacterium]
MNLFKSHFWYNKNQRNGIFLLLIIIVVLQIIIFKTPFSTNNTLTNVDSLERIAFQKQIDSLKAIAIKSRKPKIFPFNPNYITDFKGEQLGMSTTEIDKLLTFRKTGKFINSKEDFKKVTGVSDSLLYAIAPLFKFPDWVVERNRNINKSKKIKLNEQFNKEANTEASFTVSTYDINKVNQQDLMSLNIVDAKMAERIIKYRSKLQGFTFESQLYEVFNIKENQVKTILKTFKIFEKPKIKKLNINTIEFKQLLKIPYIDYELCKKIFDYRDEVSELQNIVELKNIKDFPLNKYDRITLYLLAK